MDIVADQPFMVLVSNFSNASRRLPKHMNIAWALPPPEYYVPVAQPGTTIEMITAV